MITELLVYSYFNDYFKMIAIDLSLQALDADPKAIQQIIFHANLDWDGDTIMFFITEEVKETILDFSQGTVKVLCMLSYDLATVRSTILFCFNIMSI